MDEEKAATVQEPFEQEAPGIGDQEAPGISEQQAPGELEEMLEAERLRSADLEEKLKHMLADFQNLEKKTRADIERGVGEGLDGILLDFLEIHDDFARAKDAAADGAAAAGLASVLRNMDSLLAKHGLSTIDALGEIFDPNLHEAISIIQDGSLDEGTVTREIRKGYISRHRVVRPALVEISKKGGVN
ncbi:molecular chaperone GrpE [Cenarchaeum symbiosum A]|uniref:Molecular chaperone GrpE n=1 Tax=Cenarchaeum symbiosum (strain A) TaxID=414004 RepID=A0RZ00_CENSY|nr:molecular chaperone GrpE [Cenarchaeum symbiosum A]